MLLYTTEKSGTVFIRTDQLDGETDWKLRKAIHTTQQSSPFTRLASKQTWAVVANPPNDQIYDFKGFFTTGIDDESDQREPLSLENTMWSNTVLATSGFALGLVVYTGKETRSEMNFKDPRSKVGKFDLEVNRLSKFLFLFMVLMAAGIEVLHGFYAHWYINFFRYVLLLSAIIPISLRVNMDMAKIYYCYTISKDPDIPNTIPRNSDIPEELGRIQFLLTDKTGTLTQNDMIFKKLSTEYAQFDLDSIHEVKQMVLNVCEQHTGPMPDLVNNQGLQASNSKG